MAHERPAPLDGDITTLCAKLLASGMVGSLILFDPASGRVQVVVHDIEKRAG